MMPDIWSRLAHSGRLHHFTAILADTRVCFVGHPSLHNLRHLPGVEQSLMVEVGANHDLETICGTIRALAADGVEIFGFSGPLTSSLIDRLWPELRHQCWLIDFGRLWEHTAKTPASS
jgi:hypothetical protein